MGRLPPTGRKLARDLTAGERKAQTQLFDLPDPHVDGSAVKIQLQAIKRPIWTENKARLIERYLRFFVYVTKHGTYIDGFTGPQEPDKPEMWAAKLVLDAEPWRLRHFFLCELDPEKIERIGKLRDGQRSAKKGDPKRLIRILPGDFNQTVHEVLSSGVITDKEATFCLLDQRMFELDWATVEALARHKKSGNKIELFYFLAAQWFARSFGSMKNEARLRAWWGRDDWADLNKLNDANRVNVICDRFRMELGYKTAMGWPIYSERDGGRIKYFMIHASDHSEAYKLMWRAYDQAVMPTAHSEQLDWVTQLMAPNGEALS